MSTELTSRQRAKLRGLAMNLKPLVQIGKQGLTDTAIKEIQYALTREELIKVRVVAETREERAALMASIAERTASTFCGGTGTSASYYRESDKHLIKLG